MIDLRAFLSEIKSDASCLFNDTVFPENLTCYLCGEEAVLPADQICDACRNEIRYCIDPPCPNGLDGLSCGYLYNGRMAEAVQRFKYKKALYLADILTDAIEIPTAWDFDCLVPVPLHPLRKFLRDYNQSLVLAESLAKSYGEPIRCDLLKRTRYTKSQTRLGARDRRKNLRDAFAASGAVAGLSVLLIDDVTTTGSTLLTCAEALKRAGALCVYAATACYAGK